MPPQKKKRSKLQKIVQKSKTTITQFIISTKAKIPKITSTMIFWAMCAIFAVGLYIWSQSNWLTVSSYHVVDKQLPESFNGLKIAHISDVHGLKSETVLAQVKMSLIKEEPDLICITGDLLDDSHDLERAYDFVDMCNEVAPTLFVTGESDEPYRKYNDFLETLKTHIMVLDSSYRRLQIDTDFINIIGLSYTATNTKQKYSAINKVTDLIKSNGHRSNEFTIVLCHRPDMFEAFDNEKVNLALCGHTHGGEINWPLFGVLSAKDQGLLPDYVKGEYSRDRTKMIVSGGLNNDSSKIRIRNPIEISFIIIDNGENPNHTRPNLTSVDTLYGRQSKVAIPEDTTDSETIDTEN